jgi:hypothetical protein
VQEQAGSQLSEWPGRVSEGVWDMSTSKHGPKQQHLQEQPAGTTACRGGGFNVHYEVIGQQCVDERSGQALGDLSGVQWSSVLSWTSWPAVTSARGQGHSEVCAMNVDSVLC